MRKKFKNRGRELASFDRNSTWFSRNFSEVLFPSLQKQLRSASELTNKAKEDAWHLFTSKVEGPEFEHFTNCHVLPSEIQDSMNIPKLVLSTRGDVTTWWILWMSEEQVQWLRHCTLLSADNNQRVPPFVACGRGLHLEGYYKGTNIYMYSKNVIKQCIALRSFLGFHRLCNLIFQDRGYPFRNSRAYCEARNCGRSIRRASFSR